MKSFHNFSSFEVMNNYSSCRRKRNSDAIKFSTQAPCDFTVDKTAPFSLTFMCDDFETLLPIHILRRAKISWRKKMFSSILYWYLALKEKWKTLKAVEWYKARKLLNDFYLLFFREEGREFSRLVQDFLIIFYYY